MDHIWVIKGSVRFAMGIDDKGEGDNLCELGVTLTYYQGLETPDPLTEKEERGVVAGEVVHCLPPLCSKLLLLTNLVVGNCS